MDYTKYVVYEALAGSHAYGLDQPASDVDVRGFFVPPTTEVWSLRGVPDQIALSDGSDTVYWEVKHFLSMALKANPNVLEVAFSPVRFLESEVSRRFDHVRPTLLSKRVFFSYVGFAHSEFKKLTTRRCRGGDDYQMTPKDGKEAMHALRLLISCRSILRYRIPLVHVGEQYRDSLLSVRSLQTSWADIEAWYSQLREDVSAAVSESTLPDHPDQRAAEEYLCYVRKWALSSEAANYNASNRRGKFS